MGHDQSNQKQIVIGLAAGTVLVGSAAYVYYKNQNGEVGRTPGDGDSTRLYTEKMETEALNRQREI